MLHNKFPVAQEKLEEFLSDKAVWQQKTGLQSEEQNILGLNILENLPYL
jgi:hypothetical protein